MSSAVPGTSWSLLGQLLQQATGSAPRFQTVVPCRPSKVRRPAKDLSVKSCARHFSGLGLLQAGFFMSLGEVDNSKQPAL